MAPEIELPSHVSRRPLASRSWRVSIVLSRWLARQGVSANAISVAGMVAGLLAGAAFAMTRWTTIPAVAWLVGALLVQTRLVANLLDGMVAIECKKASRLGELFNEIPDRVSDAATLIGLGYAVGSLPWLGYLAAVMAVFVAYIRSAVCNAGAPQDYSGPMAKPHRMFVVTVTALLCAVAPNIGWPTIALVLIIVGSIATALRRLWRAGQFLTRKANEPEGTTL